MDNRSPKQTILISLPIEDFQTIIIDCVTACLKQTQANPFNNQSSGEILTVSQVAELLSLSKHTIYGLIHRKQLPMMKRGNRVYFKRTHILEYLEKGAVNTLDQSRKQSTVNFKKGAK